MKWEFLNPKETEKIAKYTTFLTCVSLFLSICLFVISSNLNDNSDSYLAIVVLGSNFTEKNDIVGVYGYLTGSVPQNILQQGARAFILMENPTLVDTPIYGDNSSVFENVTTTKAYLQLVNANWNQVASSSSEEISLYQKGKILEKAQSLLFYLSIFLIFINTLYTTRLMNKIIDGSGVHARWG